MAVVHYNDATSRWLDPDQDWRTAGWHALLIIFMIRTCPFGEMVYGHRASGRCEKRVNVCLAAYSVISGCNYRTAWYLAHRIREAMVDTDAPKLTGVVEIDETCIGGKQRGHKAKRKNKDVVIGVSRTWRGSSLGSHERCQRGISLGSGEQAHLDRCPSHHDRREPRLQLPPVPLASWARYARIKHKERVYVKGDVHTNTVESAFSLLKRGLIGSFHQVSIKHLQRYLNEFGYRFNRREDADLFEQTVGRMAGVKPMPYTKLVEENAFTPFVRP